jgi:hypothetical protein
MPFWVKKHQAAAPSRKPISCQEEWNFHQPRWDGSRARLNNSNSNINLSLNIFASILLEASEAMHIFLVLILIHRAESLFGALWSRWQLRRADGNLQQQQQDETSQIKGVRVHLLSPEPPRTQKKDASIVYMLLLLQRARYALEAAGVCCVGCVWYC